MVRGFFGATAVTLKHLNVDVCYNNNALAQLNDCIRGLFHLEPNAVTFGTLLHLGPNVFIFRTLLHLGQLLYLRLQQW